MALPRRGTDRNGKAKCCSPSKPTDDGAPSPGLTSGQLFVRSAGKEIFVGNSRLEALALEVFPPRPPPSLEYKEALAARRNHQIQFLELQNDFLAEDCRLALKAARSAAARRKREAEASARRAHAALDEVLLRRSAVLRTALADAEKREKAEISLGEVEEGRAWAAWHVGTIAAELLRESGGASRLLRLSEGDPTRERCARAVSANIEPDLFAPNGPWIGIVALDVWRLESRQLLTTFQEALGRSGPGCKLRGLFCALPADTIGYVARNGFADPSSTSRARSSFSAAAPPDGDAAAHASTCRPLPLKSGDFSRYSTVGALRIPCDSQMPLGNEIGGKSRDKLGGIRFLLLSRVVSAETNAGGKGAGARSREGTPGQSSSGGSGESGSGAAKQGNREPPGQASTYCENGAGFLNQASSVAAGEASPLVLPEFIIAVRYIAADEPTLEADLCSARSGSCSIQFESGGDDDDESSVPRGSGASAVSAMTAAAANVPQIAAARSNGARYSNGTLASTRKALVRPQSSRRRTAAAASSSISASAGSGSTTPVAAANGRGSSYSRASSTLREGKAQNASESKMPLDSKLEGLKGSEAALQARWEDDARVAAAKWYQASLQEVRAVIASQGANGGIERWRKSSTTSNTT